MRGGNTTYQPLRYRGPHLASDINTIHDLHIMISHICFQERKEAPGYGARNNVWTLYTVFKIS